MKLKPAAPALAWQQQLHPDPLNIFSILNRSHTMFGKTCSTFAARFEFGAGRVSSQEARTVCPSVEMIYQNSIVLKMLKIEQNRGLIIIITSILNGP